MYSRGRAACLFLAKVCVQQGFLHLSDVHAHSWYWPKGGRANRPCFFRLGGGFYLCQGPSPGAWVRLSQVNLGWTAAAVLTGLQPFEKEPWGSSFPFFFSVSVSGMDKWNTRRMPKRETVFWFQKIQRGRIGDCTSKQNMKQFQWTRLTASKDLGRKAALWLFLQAYLKADWGRVIWDWCLVVSFGKEQQLCGFQINVWLQIHYYSFSLKLIWVFAVEYKGFKKTSYWSLF